MEYAADPVGRDPATPPSVQGGTDAKRLRILGRRTLDIVAPEIADAHEARLLEQEEKRAEQKMRFTMADDGHGCAHGRFTRRPDDPTTRRRDGATARRRDGEDPGSCAPE